MFKRLTSKVLHPRRPSIKIGGRRVALRTKEADLTPMHEIRILENSERFVKAQSIAEQIAMLHALIADMYIFPNDDAVTDALNKATRAELENAANHFLASYMTNRIQEIQDTRLLAQV